MVKHSQDPDAQSSIDSTDLEKFQEMRLRRASPKPDGRNAYEQLQTHMMKELSAYALNELMDVENPDLRRLLIDQFDALLVAEKIVLKQSERHRLIEDVLVEILEPFENDKQDSKK